MTVAVRGIGSIGARHIAVIRDVLKLQPVAVPVRANRIGDLEAKGYRVLPELLRVNGPGPHVCIIATATERHVSDTEDALGKGYSVLVEKPLSHNTDGLRRLKDLTDASGLRVFVGCNLRFHHGLRKFREMLPNIGAVHSVRIECQSYLPDWRPDSDYRTSYSARKGTGGVLLDLIHEIDYALWLFGRPEKVLAELQNSGRLGIESEDMADLLWRSPSGASMSVHLDYLTRRTRRKMMAMGAEGALEWDAIGGSVRLTPNLGEEQLFSIQQDRDAMYRDQAEAFLQVVAGGNPGNLATFDEGANSVALCDAARRSSQSRREEPIIDWKKG